jgi:hypothetical protein
MYMVQMWRVRLCLAGGGREHIGYFGNEQEGAWAYQRALDRLKSKGSVTGAVQPAIQSHASDAQQQPAAATAWEGFRPGNLLLPAESGRSPRPLLRQVSGGVLGEWGSGGSTCMSHVADARLPGSPSSALFHAHVNPSQALPLSAQQVAAMKLSSSMGAQATRPMSVPSAPVSAAQMFSQMSAPSSPSFYPRPRG